MNLVMWRREILELRKLPGWILLYGRRKTGKTFLAWHFTGWNLYVTITRDARAIVEERGGDLRVERFNSAIPLVVERLRRGETVVVDEFQRLPEAYWTMLSTAHPSGRLVLAGSSLGVLGRVFDRRSPLLGLLYPLRVDPLRLEEAVLSLAPRLGAYRSLLWGLLLREPWLAPFADLSVEPLEFLSRNVAVLASTVRGLVGEVFLEEEREPTRLYEAVLLLLGGGVWSSRELANQLYARGLLSSPSPGVVTGILDRMARMGLVAKTRLWRTRGGRIYYRHLSPLLGIVYGAMERHAVDETPVSPEMVRSTLEMLLAREAMFSLGETLARYHDGIQAYTILAGGQGDVDIVILDRRGRKPMVAYEVKLGECEGRDRKSLHERAERIGAPRSQLLCLRGGGDLDARDILEISRTLAKRWLKAKSQPRNLPLPT